MLAEVLLAIIVLLVPCLVVADVTKTAEQHSCTNKLTETAAGGGRTVDERTGANATAALLRKFFRLGPENLGVRPASFCLLAYRPSSPSRSAASASLPRGSSMALWCLSFLF